MLPNISIAHRRPFVKHEHPADALFRADAAMHWRKLQDRELRAGAALRLAGYSSGRGVCARGVTDGVIRNAECGIEGAGAVLRSDGGSIAAL